MVTVAHSTNSNRKKEEEKIKKEKQNKKETHRSYSSIGLHQATHDSCIQ